MRRKLLALLLVLVMVVSIMPLAAYAEGDDDVDTTTVATVDGGEDNKENNGGNTEGSSDTEGNDSAEGSGDTEGNDSTEGSGDTEGNDSTEGSDNTEGNDNTEGGEEDNTIPEHVHQPNEFCKCEICGETVHRVFYVEKDAAQHHKKCYCRALDAWEDHVDNDNNGICDDCGYVFETHEHHIVYNPCGQYGHTQSCDECHMSLSDPMDHVMQNGKCTLCGFVPCADGNHSYNTEGYGYERHICQICGYISDCVDEDDDCACDICNWEYYHYNEPQKDENLHWVCCEQCGLTSAKDPHYDYNEDGKCDFCGYNMNGTDDAGTGSDDSGLDNVPKTGDVSILVMGAMVLLFGTGAVLAVKKYAI